MKCLFWVGSRIIIIIIIIIIGEYEMAKFPNTQMKNVSFKGNNGSCYEHMYQ